VILDIAFQPIVALASDRVYGYEALGRPRTLAGEALAIGVLLAEARAAGELLALDRALRRRAIECIVTCPRDPQLRWFLNVDSRCADSPGYSPGYTRRVLAELGAPELQIVIELGEQDPLLDRRRLAAMVPSYARQGFSIALDDFGAGHATLSRLVEVRPQFVKLDPSLVHGVADDPMRASLLRAFAGFAAESGILLVAEGIEREADLAFVIAAGVPLGQGYLLGRPAPLDRAAVAGPSDAYVLEDMPVQACP